MVLASFLPSTSGITAQSQALSSVSSNIANISTTGYKETETMFHTLLGGASSSNTYSSVDVTTQGVAAYDRTLVTKEGMLAYTGNTYDVAISGNSNAFFVVNDANGNSYYTRAGNFGVGINGDSTYLSTSTGLSVQGYAYLGDGQYSTTLSDIELSSANQTISSTPTTNITFSGNVPASGVDTSSYGLTVYGENNEGETVAMLFTKADDALNTWDVTFSTSDGTVISDPQRVTFGTDGLSPTPSTLNLDIEWGEEAGGGSSSVTIDISDTTQLSGSSAVTSITQNGMASGTLEGTFIDDDGIVRASYTNGQKLPIAQIGLAGFASPDSLMAMSNTLFSATSASGASYELADSGAYIKAEYLESSTVNIESSFSELILVQRAYSLNTQSFTVSDEMLQEVVNLKA